MRLPAAGRRPMCRRSTLVGAALLFAPLLTTADGKAEPVNQSMTVLTPFTTSPFPYDGFIPPTEERPETDQPFLDVIEDGRRGHTSPRGGLLWEDQHYSDRRTLLFVPAGFDLDRPATLVVFFHGNNSTLERDVIDRQQVPAQLEASGLNAILAAPQFAFDAPDSSGGGFWRPQAFRNWLAEAAEKLAPMLGDAALQARLDALPVVLVSYSGGYDPAAFALDVGGADDRICGVILLDSLYDQEDLFADWIARRGDGFFVSAYTQSSAFNNETLQALLAARGIPFTVTPEDPLPAPGAVTFRAIDGEAIEHDVVMAHDQFVTQAWRENPIQWLLARLAERGLCGG